MDDSPGIARAFDLARQGQYGQCEALCHELLARDAADFNVPHLLGLVRMQQGRPAEAADWLAKAAAAAPDMAFVQANLGLALSAAGRIGEARERLRAAVRLAPDDAGMHFNLGTVLAESSSHAAEAEGEYREALRLDPAHALARWNLSASQLARGDWQAGWDNHRARNDIPALAGLLALYRDHPAPAWDGHAPLAGRSVLVCPEAGFGDVIMMARYVPALAARGARVHLLVPHEMARLAQTLGGVEQAIVFGDGAVVLPRCDFKLSLFDLPAVLGGSPESAPRPPYLAASPAGIARWHARLDALDPGHARLRVGVTWAGRPDNTLEVRRGVPLELLARIVERHTGQVLFASMQKGEASRQLAIHAPGWIDLGAECADFADTAALAAALDWVVSSDTGTAHLAGALGLDAAILLHTPSDWRWGREGTRSPWYPAPRLLRQPSPGDWPGALRELDAALEKRIAAHHDRKEKP